MSNISFGNISEFQTDPVLESKTGITLDYGGGRGLQVLRTGGANTKYPKILQEKLKPYSSLLRSGGDLSPEVRARIEASAFAEGAVTNWWGWVDKKGKEIPFTPENCTALFLEAPQIFQEAVSRADNWTNFRIQELKEDAKLLGEQSAGK